MSRPTSTARPLSASDAVAQMRREAADTLRAGLADCIGTLVADVSLRSRLAAAARDVAERTFTRARMVGDVAPVYRSLVAGPS